MLLGPFFKRTITVSILTFGVAVGSVAQPVVTGVANAASYARPGLPNSGIAQGSMFVVFGRNLGPASLAQVSSFPLPTSAGLAGTSVRISAGGMTIDAIMIYTVATQVAAVLPSRTPVGNATLTVTFGGQTSAPFNFRVVRSTFGTFTRNQAGSGPGIFQNVVSATDQPVNGLTRPARPGQTVIAWGTGLGPVTGDEAAGPLPGNLDIDTEVWVGSQRAVISYRGRSGCCTGIDQIAFVVPQNVSGCYVPVVIRNGEFVSNFATLAVSASGNTCSDPGGLTGSELDGALSRGSLRIGSISLSRFGLRLDLGIPGAPVIEVKTDSGDASFTRLDLAQLEASQQFNAQSLGACSVVTFGGSTPVTSVIDPIRGTALDAGPVLNLNGPRGAKQLTKQSDGSYAAELGGGGTLPGTGQPDYLEPGTYTVDNGSGGAGPNAVGGFRASLTIPSLVTWSNQAAVSTVTRANGQEITWTGGDPNSFVYIVGASVNQSPEAGAVFACTERTGAGRFTIPPVVLLALPASTGSGPVGPNIGGFLAVGNSGNPVRFTASGLDVGTFSYSSATGKSVTFR